jgi:mannosyltransferase
MLLGVRGQTDRLGEQTAGAPGVDGLAPGGKTRPRMMSELAATRRLAAQRLALPALVVVGAWLRFSELDSRSFWRDECLTVRGIGLPVVEWLDGLLATERTPPLYYLFMKVWAGLFGLSEAAMRFPSALAGTLTILVAYAVARRLVSPRAGLAAAAIAATSPMLVWFSLDARPYAFLVLFCGL